jgi:hypothetical protein
MPRDKIYEDLSVVVSRATSVFRVVGVLIFLALAYYWKVQILDFKEF